MANIECEIKIKLDKESYKILQEWLKANAKHIKEIHHIEHYLDNPNSTFVTINQEGIKDAEDYLRVRFTEKGDSICLKKWHRDPNDPLNYTHCDEYETEVKDGKTVLELFNKLGYTNETIIDKKRAIYVYEQFEIVIDEVKDLGIFAEFGLKEDIEDPEKSLKLIDKFIKEIGIENYQHQRRGYVSMFWNPDIDYIK